MFMRIHQSQPRRIVLDPMEQVETSGPGFFSENKVSLVSFASKKTPPFWNKHCWNQRLWNFDLSWQIWTPKQSCERLWNTIGLARIFSTREVNVVEICKCEEENWLHASKGAAYSRHRVSVHSSEWVSEWESEAAKCLDCLHHLQSVVFLHSITSHLNLIILVWCGRNSHFFAWFQIPLVSLAFVFDANRYHFGWSCPWGCDSFRPKATSST